MTDEITIMRKLRCVERELKLRRNVYPGLVRKGKMTTDQAMDEISVMEAIVADYKAQVLPGIGR